MANYDAGTIAEFLTTDANVVNRAAESLRGIFSLGTNEQRVNVLKYMVTYGRVPTYDEAKKIFGKSGLSEDRYNDFLHDAKNALNATLNNHAYMNDKGESVTLTFENLSNIPQIKANQDLYDKGYNVSVENFNSVTDANGKAIDRNSITGDMSTSKGYGNRETYNHIVNSIADDIHGLGNDSQQIALVEYYLEHGDLPKDVVDDVIGRSSGKVGNTRYNNLVDKIEEAANAYFTNNPDNLSKEVINSYKQTFTDNKNATIGSYKDYNFEDAAKIKTSETVAEAAVKSFNVTGTPYSEEIALVKHFMTYGTITREDMAKIMGKKNIGDVRYDTILTKVSNSVAEAMRSQGYMPDATNEQIIESIYKSSESARTDKAAGYDVQFGYKVTPPKEEENKPNNTTDNGGNGGDDGNGGNGGNDSNGGNDDVIDDYEKPSYKEESFNQYYKDTWDTSPGTTAYSIWSNLTQAERNAATEAMSLADAQYQNAAMQQAATVKNITDQVRAERMAKLRAGMNEAQIANQDMQMMMSNINAMNDRIAAINDNRLAAQMQYNLAQDTAYKEYLNNAQAMNQTGAAYYAAQAGDPYSQALNYMNKTGSSFSDSFKAVTTGTTDSTKK